jgi:hypothetical protein
VTKRKEAQKSRKEREKEKEKEIKERKIDCREVHKLQTRLNRTPITS